MGGQSLSVSIEERILSIRAKRVMLDFDLAKIYCVPTKVLNQAVKRNLKRFPLDFMFQLDRQEVTQMRSQIVTASRRNLRYPPYAFTEHGVLMLANILNSERAIEASVQVVRVFIRLRQMLTGHAELSHRLDELERKYNTYFKQVFTTIRQLMEPPPELPKRRIGFHP